MNIKSNQYISHMISGSLTIICLLLCHSWYFGVWKPQEVDYGNLFILALFFYLTWQKLCGWYINRTEKATFSREVTPKDKILNIEFLRVVFTLEIVVHHTMKSLGVDNRGWLGVEFFFILSGFFLAYSCNKNCSMLDFIHKKIVRFIPLIVAGSLLNILYQQNINVSRFLSAVFFLPGTGLVSRHSDLGPAWYLAVLFWGLIFYFYVIKNCSEHSRNLIFGVLTFFASIAWIHGASVQWGDFQTLGNKGTIGYLFNMSFIRGIMNIGLGYFIAIYFMQVTHNLNKKASNLKWYLIFGMIESFILIYSILMIFDKNLFPNQAIFVNISFITLICLWLIRKGLLSNLTNNILFLKMSKYSLAIYLCHSCIVEHLIPLLKRKYSGYIMEHTLEVVTISLIASILIGIWAHYVIEKPCGKFLRKVLK